jgi:large repetitive protein
VGASYTVACEGNVVFSSPTASDNCDTNPTFGYTDNTVPGACAQEYVITRTWTTTDACGNSSTASQTITVIDTLSPVISGVGASYTVACEGNVVFSNPTVSDNCDTNPTFGYTDNTVSGACAQEYTFTRTWTATDACGNSTTASQTITVIDTLAPVISGVGTSYSIACGSTPIFSNPTVSDNCDTNPTFGYTDNTVPGACAQEYVITRTWTATDACGNTATASQTITVIDTLAPVISGVGASYSSACGSTPVFSSPTVSDNCDSNPTFGYTDNTVAGACAQEYTITRTWTATDACGNSSTASQTITVIDTLAPVISGVGASYTVACEGNVVFSSPTVSDNCDSNPNFGYTDNTIAGACAQEYTITRTWTATDACGNSTTASQTITVIDTLAPVISGVGASYTVACEGNVVFSSPTVSDNCDSNPNFGYTDNTIAGACAQEYTITRTWTATDACGNTTTVSQTITVIDTVAPSISQPGNNETISCPDLPIFKWPTASDNCDPSPSVVVVSDNTYPGTYPGSYSRTISWKAVDCSGNESGSVSQTITVVDTIAPVISGIGNTQTQSCSDPLAFSLPTVIDDCDLNPFLTYVDSTSQGPCALGFSITRTWTATDAAGNYTTASQTINVIDTTPPVIDQPGANITISCPDVPLFTPPTAFDNCDANPIIVEVSDITVPGRCSGAYTRTVTWKAIDCAGNESSTVSQSITVVDDITPVIHAVGADQILSCNSAIVFSQPYATDNCDSNPVITYLDKTHTGKCSQEYSITRIWTASDACGNISTASQTITIVDDVPPVFSNIGPNQTINCGSSPVFSTPVVSDNCDTDPDLTYSDTTLAGSCMQEYSIVRTWTATDACGNWSSTSQTITVVDTSAPVFSGVGSDQTISCGSVPVFSTPIVTDNCDQSPLLSYTDSTFQSSCSQGYSITRTWTATDDCGNSASASQTITIVDDVAPVITGIGPDQTISCGSTPVFSTPEAADNCDTMPTLTYSDTMVQGQCAQGYTITRTWTATDACGNFAQASQSILVVDTEAPVIIGIGQNQILACDASLSFSTPVATDNCDNTPILSHEDFISNAPCASSHIITRVWTATDACGNTTTASQSITITDTVSPAIGNAGPNQTIECPALPEFNPPMATDNCDPNPKVIIVSDVTMEGSCPGTFSRTIKWKAVDCAGNESGTVSQTITVVDNTPPVVVAPAGFTITCDDDLPVCNPADATASDNCGTVTVTCTDTFAPTISSSSGSNDSCEGTITRTYTATDACGNTSTPLSLSLLWRIRIPETGTPTRPLR